MEGDDDGLRNSSILQTITRVGSGLNSAVPQAISRRTQERSKFCCLLFCCCSHNDFLWPSTVLTGMGKQVIFGHFLGIKKH